MFVQHNQVHQLAAEGLQPPSLVEDVSGALAHLFLCGRPGAEQVGIADDGGQGRLDLVGKAAGEILLPLGGGFQLLNLPLDAMGHYVEVR